MVVSRVNCVGSMIAMRFGDNAWIKGVQSDPSLNGKRVTLHTWQDEAQRWRCKPVNWTFSQPFISLRPRNLSGEPPAPLPAASPAADGRGMYAAARLVSLMEREEQLRKRIRQSDRASTLRYQLCQLKLLEIQRELFGQQEGRNELYDKAQAQLLKQAAEVERLIKEWQQTGRAVPDIWDDDNDDDEPDLKIDDWHFRTRSCALKRPFPLSATTVPA